MRVLFVNHGAAIGGAETNLLNILRFAPLGGFEPVGVLLPSTGPLESEVRKLGIEVAQINYHALRWRNPLKYARTLTQLVTSIRRTRPAVIHLNHQWLVSHIVQAGILTGTPVVCHVRNYLDGDFVAKNRRWLEKSASLLAVSRATQLRALELGLPATKTRLLHDGIELACISCPIGSRSSTPNSDAPTVGYVGRVVPEKGVEDLVRAIPLALKSIPSARFRVVGEDQQNGAYIRRLESIAEKLDVKQSVEFVGFRTDVQSILGEIDVLAVPSRTSMPEGLPLVVLEGLAAGCMVVATPNSGVPEVIHHGETGFLIPFEHSEAIGQTIVTALTLSDSEKDRIRRAGLDLIESQFSIERQISCLWQVYQELLA